MTTTPSAYQSVGVAQLKARLSHYLAQAATGTRVLITDHGRPVAELSPLSPEVRTALALVDSGKASWSGGKPQGLDGPVRSGGRAAAAVIEDRR